MKIPEVIVIFSSTFFGALSAFYLNYKKEEENKKQEEILKSREFLSRLFTVAERSYNYYLNNINIDEPEQIWKTLPPSLSGLIPREVDLKVSEIAFCEKTTSNIHKGFLSEAYMLELDIERMNYMLNKHAELTEEIEKEIQRYLYEEEKQEEKIDVKNLNYYKILGYRKASTYKSLCMDIIGAIPKIYIVTIEIKDKHREIMKELYPNAEIRDFTFEIPSQEELKEIIENQQQKVAEFEENILNQLNQLNQLNLSQKSK